MKKTYEQLSMTPIGLIPECDILGASILVKENVTVEAYHTETGFELGFDDDNKLHKGYSIEFE